MFRLSVALLVVSTFCFSQEYYEGGKKIALTPTSTPPQVVGALSSASIDSVVWYTTADGRSIGVKQEILITWENPAAKEQVLQKYSFDTREDLSNTMTLLSLDSAVDIFALSIQLYDEPATKSAQPNLIKERVQR